MDYLQSLLSLDGITIANYDRILQDPRPSKARPEHIRLLMALKAEAETAAMLVAVCASLANALSREHGTRPAARCLTTFSPPELSLFQASTTALIGSEASVELVPTLQDFAARLSFARQMSQVFVTESPSARAAASIDAEALSDAWRKACLSAQGALAGLSAELRRHVTATVKDPSEGLIEQLQQAEAGLSPCVERDGCVIVPGWAERRQSKRIRVDIAAEVHLGPSIRTARVFDVSTGGMGLRGLENLRRGDSVLVKLAYGRRFRGTIAWVAGDKAGVRFQQALPADDALLCV